MGEPNKQTLLEEITSLFSSRSTNASVRRQYVTKMKTLLPQLINEHLVMDKACKSFILNTQNYYF